MKKTKNVSQEENESLTRMEWLTIFFVSFNPGPRLLGGTNFIQKRRKN